MSYEIKNLIAAFLYFILCFLPFAFILYQFQEQLHSPSFGIIHVIKYIFPEVPFKRIIRVSKLVFSYYFRNVINALL